MCFSKCVKIYNPLLIVNLSLCFKGTIQFTIHTRWIFSCVSSNELDVDVNARGAPRIKSRFSRIFLSPLLLNRQKIFRPFFHPSHINSCSNLNEAKKTCGSSINFTTKILIFVIKFLINFILIKVKHNYWSRFTELRRPRSPLVWVSASFCRLSVIQKLLIIIIRNSLLLSEMIFSRFSSRLLGKMSSQL